MPVNQVYQVYALYDPRTFNETYYIGCTSKGLRSRWQSHVRAAITASNNQPVIEWVRELIRDNVEPGIRLIEKTTKEDWAAREKHWIAHHAGPLLLNAATGGAPGVKLSPRRLTKLRESRKGIPNSIEHNLKISVANTGHVHSDEVRLRISQARTGKNLGPLSEEHKEKISVSHLGRVFSDEHKRKLAIANRARWEDPAHRAHMSTVHKGRITSDATKAKMSASGLGRKMTDETKAKISASRRETQKPVIPTIWINDGARSRRLQSTLDLPLGWQAGRYRASK